MSGTSTNDRTQGGDAVVYQHCARCGGVQYFQRSFCAACGAPEIETRTASGEGTVFAVSLVHRAATPEARAHVPYLIVLVDMAEGFRVMGHGAHDLSIGDAVMAGSADFGGRSVPYFSKRAP